MVYRILPPRFSKLLSAISIVVVTLCLPAGVLAGSYDVNAQVYPSVLSQPAVFSSGLDGSTTSSGNFTVDGSCQMLNQATVITIWRDNTALGSTVCNSGNFRLTIVLQDGVNNLVARSSDVSANYGPDSQPIAVTLSLPAANPVPASTASGTEPATPAEEQAAVNAGIAADLVAVTATPFSVISNQKTISIDVKVTGGNQPYVIMLNWGDGTTESHSVSQTGTYSYAHTYQKVANYQIKGTVRDVLGAYTEFSYAVVSYVKRVPVATATAGSPNQSPLPAKTNTVIYSTATTAVIIIGLLAVYGGYRLGLHQASKALIRAARQRRRQPVKRTAKRARR